MPYSEEYTLQNEDFLEFSQKDQERIIRSAKKIFFSAGEDENPYDLIFEVWKKKFMEANDHLDFERISHCMLKQKFEKFYREKIEPFDKL